MRLLAALAGVMLIAGGVAFALFKLSPEGDCSDRLVSEARAPDGRAIAAVYEHTCGAEVATRVALRRQAAFVARGDVAAFAGRARVEVRWEGPRALSVVAGGKPMLVEGAWHEVAVSVLRR
jgi:hypothetical protein